MSEEELRRLECAKTAKSWLDQDPLILDTETTGLSPDAEVIEISAIDGHGKTVIDTLVRPTIPIDPSASAVRKIYDQDLIDAPTWADLNGELLRVIRSRLVIAYNAPFDYRIILATADKHHNFEWGGDWFEPVCAMRLYATFWGEFDDRRGSWRWQSLANAAAQCGVKTGTAHRALADCRSTLGILNFLAHSLD